MKLRRDEQLVSIQCRNAQCLTLNTSFYDFLPNALAVWNSRAKDVVERRSEYQRARMHYYSEAHAMASCLVGRPDVDQDMQKRRLKTTLVFGKVNCKFCRKRGPDPAQERALRDRRAHAQSKARARNSAGVTVVGHPRLDGAD